MMLDKIDLLRAARAGDAWAEAQLFEANQGLIHSVEKRFYGRGIEPEDVHQLASIGFIKAVRGYDETYGTEFSTYAVPKIMGEIRRQLRDDGPIKISRHIYENNVRIRKIQNQLENKLGRSPTVTELSEATGLSVEQIAVCVRSGERIMSFDDDPFKEDGSLYDRIMGEGIEDPIILRESLRQAIQKLPERLAQIISLRYQHGLTQTQTAKLLGVSQVQISRLEKKSLLLLRETML